jgi:hypothetical protein
MTLASTSIIIKRLSSINIFDICSKILHHSFNYSCKHLYIQGLKTLTSIDVKVKVYFKDLKDCHKHTSLLYHSFNNSNNKFYSLGPMTQANTTLKKLKGLRSLKIVINALAYSITVLITAILNFIVQVHGSSQNYLNGQLLKIHLGTSLLYHSFNYINNKFYSPGPQLWLTLP